MSWPLRILVLTGITLGGLAIWTQPKVADDWNLIWTLADAGSTWQFVKRLYLTSGGRVFPFVLAGTALSSEMATYAFKVLTAACFLLFSACAYYLGTSTLPRKGTQAFPYWLLVTAVLWLGLPVLSDTVVQVTGACAYLWPATAGLAFLCLYRRAYAMAREGPAASGPALHRIGWLGSGIVVGTCNEQLFAGIAVVLAGFGALLWRDAKLRNLPTEAWWGIAGLALGTLVLVAAPGNYTRLGAEQWQGGGAGSMLFRYVAYLGGAYFALGTGDSGRTLWLGLSIIALGGAFSMRGDRGKEAALWVAGSVATLAPMLPLVNVASPRTTFLAATFLVIAVLRAFPRENDAGIPGASVWLVAYALAVLAVIDGLAGVLANRSVAIEMAAREKIMSTAASEGKRNALVPHLATVPSRLTYILNPQYDAQFVPKLARHYGLDSGSIDSSPGAPAPYSVNPLKAFKNSL